jgi:predicted ATPase
MMIAEGSIRTEDVIIYFVEKDEFSNHSSVRRGGFNTNGSIENWPVGFFSGSM